METEEIFCFRTYSNPFLLNPLALLVVMIKTEVLANQKSIMMRNITGDKEISLSELLY
jgi:hypothetical protein